MPRGTGLSPARAGAPGLRGKEPDQRRELQMLLGKGWESLAAAGGAEAGGAGRGWRSTRGCRRAARSGG